MKFIYLTQYLDSDVPKHKIAINVYNIISFEANTDPSTPNVSRIHMYDGSCEQVRESFNQIRKIVEALNGENQC